MKKMILILMMLVGGVMMAQDQKVEVVKNGDLYEATYYHENGAVAQQGFFDADGKLHGVWKSYDAEGNKVAVGTYENGKKTGKWLFWSEAKLTEVDYKDFKIQKVNEWQNKTQLAIRE